MDSVTALAPSAAARYQVARVARLRGVSPEKVQALVDQYTGRPLLDILGEPHVHVLQLNMALQALR